jgi:hopanoid biosynthesis associated radical SAM protein HpnH
MRYPFGLVFDSAKHRIAGKLRGERKRAVMVSLDPLGGCTNAYGCANNGTNGAGAVADRPMLSVEQCLAALDECDAPVVSICGGEPLEYPEIPGLTRAILDRGKHLFLCTDGTLIRRRLHMIPPETNFFWNVKLDGTEKVHDARARRAGLFVEALDGVKAAKNAGFFVVMTTTIYPDTDVNDVAALYQVLHAMHVDGYMFSPFYPQEKLCRNGSAAFHEKMHQRFREVTSVLGDYNVMTSPIYLEYLRGERELDCCAWGSPVYGPKGWMAPCYLQDLGYAKSYKALLEDTVWENYGRGINPRCETCMSHAGYESAALLGANPKAGDRWKMLAWQLRGSLGEKREGTRKP